MRPFPLRIPDVFLSVHSCNVVDSHRTQDSDADQADGSAALHYHSAVKTEDSCGFRSFHRVDENGAGLNEGFWNTDPDQRLH